MTDVFTLHQGTAPLLVSLPHVGTQIPEALAARFVPRALAVEDTDWHLDRLYAFAPELGASVLVPRYSRYVIDLNRPPEDESLYPGQDVTGLIPLDTFRKEPLYRPGQLPDAAEKRARVARYWQPYHDALRGELDRLRAQHGQVVLWEAHSICSVLPRFFDGKLPDLNLGTAEGRACAPAAQAAVEAQMQAQDRYTHVSNGRFKGGHITRHYGAPAHGIHALQLRFHFQVPDALFEQLPRGFVLGRVQQGLGQRETGIHRARLGVQPRGQLGQVGGRARQS